jgi:uncharacterized protein YjbI with pentapeptide repeats
MGDKTKLLETMDEETVDKHAQRKYRDLKRVHVWMPFVDHVVDLSGCSLLNVDLSNAQITSVNFAGAKFESAQLDDAYIGIRHTIGEAKFDGAEFGYCSCTEAVFTGSSFVGAKFTMASLRGANFYRTRYVRARRRDYPTSRMRRSSLVQVCDSTTSSRPPAARA